MDFHCMIKESLHWKRSSHSASASSEGTPSSSLAMYGPFVTKFSANTLTWYLIVSCAGASRSKQCAFNIVEVLRVHTIYHLTGILAWRLAMRENNQSDSERGNDDIERHSWTQEPFHVGGGGIMFSCLFGSTIFVAILNVSIRQIVLHFDVWKKYIDAQMNWERNERIVAGKKTPLIV